MRSGIVRGGVVFGGILLWLAALVAQAGLVGDVRTQLAQNSFSAAESELRTYKAQHGATPEYLEALSWMARGAASTQHWDQATAYATETRPPRGRPPAHRSLDAEHHLPTAPGAAQSAASQRMPATRQHPPTP